MPRVVGGSQGGRRFLMSEAPLQAFGGAEPASTPSVPLTDALSLSLTHTLSLSHSHTLSLSLSHPNKPSTLLTHTLTPHTTHQY